MAQQRAAFEGTVLSVSEGEFVATLVDLDHPTAPREQATFDIRAVPPAARELVRPGAFFRWTISCDDTWRESDAGFFGSVFEFARETWSAQDLEAAKREAEDYRWMFDCCDDEEPAP